MDDQEITWYGTVDAAKYLGVTQRTVYALIDRGELVAYKVGRVVRIRQSDLDTFLEANRVEPGSLAHLYPQRKPDPPTT